MKDQEYVYQEAKTRVFDRLVFTNLFILVGGGALSYYLARRTLKPIEDAHAAQSRFTADASHELRTPIAAMQTEIEVILMDPNITLTKTKKVLLSNLEELIKLTALTEGLLKMAQLENGDMPQEDIAVSKLVSDAINRVQPAVDAKHVKLATTNNTVAVVVGDPSNLTEAIVVLLDNAIKYSPDKTEVRVQVRAADKQVSIEITDQGMGINTKDLAHIFERFYRADTARSKTQTDGYGVGLAIAKNIVELHNGTISAKSKQGKGATFIIQLPTV